VDAARPRPQAVPERGLAVSAARPAPSAARTASPASAPVPHLNALPAELRQSLPPLKLGGAMYSDNAESRVLVLNDQLWHEGEHPAPELLLERIQPHAAQLNFRGQRFQLTY
jgi:general secretion pathway protein B